MQNKELRIFGSAFTDTIDKSKLMNLFDLREIGIIPLPNEAEQVEVELVFLVPVKRVTELRQYLDRYKLAYEICDPT